MPSWSLERYGVGESAQRLNVGDVLLVEGSSWSSGLIRFFDGSPYSHVVIATGHSFVADAQARGVVLSQLSRYDSVPYTLVRVQMSDEDRWQVRDFLDSVALSRWRYNWLGFFAAGLAIATGYRVSADVAGTAFCSGLACEALVRAGWIFPKPPRSMTPKDLAKFVGAVAEANATVAPDG